MDLDKIFNPKSVAVIGVSENPNKIGSVIFRTLTKLFKGESYQVNKNHDFLYGKVCYPSITDLVKETKHKPELVVIAVPVNEALKVLEESGKLGIKNCIMVTAGFKEIGNNSAENKLQQIIKKRKINMIGPNCLGVLNTSNNLDTLFLPPERLQRPKKGNISFISQSGAVGSAVVDLAASQNLGFSKFVSYGNAANIDESDLLEFLEKDDDTHVICMYLEGVHNGERFFEVAKRVAKKKPVIAIKGGLSDGGKKATLSHTGSLAGNASVYEGIFKQTGILEAHSLEEVFDYAKIFSFIKNNTHGRNVQIITNGGGYGILAADAVEQYGLSLTQLETKSVTALQKKFPSLVTVSNPLDLVGDANNERYEIAIETCLEDKNVDMLLVIILSQTPLIDLDIVPIIERLSKSTKKPIISVTTGGAYSHELKEMLESVGIPCYDFPHNAVNAMKELVDFAKK